MPELLLELGCEELPAHFVRKAYTELFEAIAARLRDRGIPHEPGEGPLGTPRRLIVHFREVASEQPSRTEDKRGPSERAAFDAEGNPAGPLLGFCRGLSVDPNSVRREGGYVWATQEIPGRLTLEVLGEILPDAIKSLTFEKAMRWGASRMRFARPIRWIVASFGGQAVPFEIEGVRAGLESRGHRFFHPEPFEVDSFEALVSQLRERKVEPDASTREQRIRSEAQARASGSPLLSDGLVDENVFLTEWPEAHEGSFKPEYLELPEPVLVTAMAKHERFFPICGADGKLTNRFVSIRNGGDEDTVRAGNEWVLNARFNDARFFFEEDKRLTFADFLEKTSGIVFQEKLGTIRQRAERLAALSEAIAKENQTPDADPNEPTWARLAGLYSKADLSTGLVSELASLQGVVGGEYAKREGFPDAVCWAISSHYDLDRNPKIECSGARSAIRVLMADQLDKLVGYLGLGLAPSGSSDPFGLRRAATMLLEAALRWPERFSGFEALINDSLNLYREQAIDLKPDVADDVAALFASRYEGALEGFRHDVLEAAIMQESTYQLDRIKGAPLDPQAVQFRCKCLDGFAKDSGFVQTCTRPINIVSDAGRKGVGFDRQDPLPAIDAKALDSETGAELLLIVQNSRDTLQTAAKNGDVQELIDGLSAFGAPINAFFEATMINAEQENAKLARLNLVNAVCELLSLAGDFSKIVIEGN